MRVIPLVVVENEIKELELAAILGGDPPVQEGAKGIVLHEAVEQSAYLLTSPYELSLDGGQHKITALI